MAIAAAALPAALILGSCAVPNTSAVPAEYEGAVRKAAKNCTALKPDIVAAQIEAESGWDPNAISRRNAQGIAQFIPSTWDQWGEDTDGNGLASPFDPKDAIAAQGRLMCHLIERAQASSLPQDSVRLALAGYNAGWGAVEEHRGIPPYPETRDYIAKISDRAPAYRKALRQS